MDVVGPKPAQINEPKQTRSRKTLERIVAAALDILSEDGPDGLTVNRVVKRAGSSVGSFYARFKGKDDLLDYLEERVWTAALERWEEALASRDWSGVGLAEMTEGAVGLLIDAQRSRSRFLVAIDQAGPGQGRAFEQFQAQIVEGLATLFLERRAEIVHEDPELAVHVALCGVLGVIEAEGDGRLGSEELPRETLVREASALLKSYLTGTASPGDAGGVEFFDVWG